MNKRVFPVYSLSGIVLDMIDELSFELGVLPTETETRSLQGTRHNNVKTIQEDLAMCKVSANPIYCTGILYLWCDK